MRRFLHIREQRWTAQFTWDVASEAATSQDSAKGKIKSLKGQLLLCWTGKFVGISPFLQCGKLLQVLDVRSKCTSKFIVI